MKLTIGFSPCPNDTFIFDALVNNKIDTEGIEFDVVLEDVQTLNKWALQKKLDISKISYGVLPLILNEYVLLDSGGALGKGVGPLLISSKEIENLSQVISNLLIAIPGENTTANLLFSYAFPSAIKKKFMVFHEIEKQVLNHEVDAGVIIHENRFNYAEKGLKKIIDLGEFWEEKTGNPIPLGGIIMDNKIENSIQRKVDNLIKKSLEHAWANYPDIAPYVSQHSQEMSEEVMRKHINLYVNNFSLSLGTVGRNAVRTLLDVYGKMNNSVIAESKIFVK